MILNKYKFCNTLNQDIEMLPIATFLFDYADYGKHLAIDNVLIYEDCMFATVAVSKKKEDTYMDNIVDGDDLEEDKRDAFAEAMQSLIEFILQ